MDSSYDPAPDAIAFMATRTPVQRHAIARLLAANNLDAPYESDDMFDSLWERQPVHADIVDWLTGKPESVWLAAVDDLRSSHPDEIYDWMHAQPECAQSVKDKIETGAGRPGEPQAL